MTRITDLTAMPGYRLLPAWWVIYSVTCLFAIPVFAQGTAQFDSRAIFVQTDSPRDTLKTFLKFADDSAGLLRAYSQDPTYENIDRIREHVRQFQQLLDLSSVPSAAREKVGKDTLINLLDILGRVDLPPLKSVPGAGGFEGEKTIAKWRIPQTPITITRVVEGAREGEFLFSERTIVVAQGFYERVRHLPLRSSIGVASWNDALNQLHGPLIPVRVVAALPDSLKWIWLDTPIWKILTAVITVVLAINLLILCHRLINRQGSTGRIGAHIRQALTPLAIILVILAVELFIEIELNVVGRFAIVGEFVSTLLLYLAAAWIFWPVLMLLFEWVIRSPRIQDDSLEANILRLSARILGYAGIVFILALGASELGLPVFGLLTGLGVGGLAVALAIRPTLENLIGGVNLFIDKPVRIGDFCGFGDQMGTVEYIGVRSTKIRALDRTLISIPNAAFADMEIVNWAKCDKMLIERTIGLRYETEPDQLRFVLVKLREMCHAHPKIDRDTVRVRFVGHNSSSLDIEVRVYALTTEWNEFYAIQEDVLLRVDEIVRESGTGFAFPSQTVYLRRDSGLDQERSESAIREVASWRRSNRLPFPNMPTKRLDELEGTLDYPPRNSPVTASQEAQTAEVAEPLSVEQHPEETEQDDKISKS